MAALFLFLRRMESEPDSTLEIKRWIAWGLKFLSSNSCGSSGLDENEYLLVLKISLCLAEKSGAEDGRFDFIWVPNLFEYPRFRLQAESTTIKQ